MVVAHLPRHYSLGHGRVAPLQPAGRERSAVHLGNAGSRHLHAGGAGESVPGRHGQVVLVAFRRVTHSGGTGAVLAAELLVVGTSYQRKKVLGELLLPAVALTQIYAYSAHRNLAVRKIMEAMRTAYAKKRDLVSTRLKLHDHGRHASIVKGKRASFTNNISVFRWIVWWW